MKYVALFITVVIVLAGAFYIYRVNNDAAPAEANATTTPPFEVVATPYEPPVNDTAPAGLRTYRNSLYRFFLQYPEDLRVIERKEGPDAHSITFENTDASKGFQIFIVDYKEPQITKSRIDLDTKKGIEGEPVEIVLPATRALMFYSKDPLFGRLREVWFLREGHLYEVTTYAELDTWLASIMQTWRFQ